jgi:hypothetical protein
VPNREIFLQLPREGKVESAVVEMAYPIRAATMSRRRDVPH